MIALNYRRPGPRPFPLRLAIASYLTFFITLAYFITCRALTDPPFPLPHWLKDIFPPIIPAAILASILGCVAIPLADLTGTKLRRAATLGLWIIPAASPLLLFTSFPPSERHYCFPPGQTIETSMRELAYAAVSYASDHAGHFPPDLATLLHEGTVSTQDLVDYDTRPASAPPPITNAEASARYPSELNSHSVIIYTGAGLVDSKLRGDTFQTALDPSIVLAYTKECRTLGTIRIVFFINFECRWVSNEELTEILTASDAARSRPPSLSR